jgi:hypothetical protein
MTTIRFMSLAALLAAPILAMAEPAKGAGARESSNPCECMAKKQAADATAQAGEWIRRMTTTME